MTIELFKKTLDSCGQFYFMTEKYEGMIGIDPEYFIIWVDDAGFGKSNSDEEPKFIGEYKSVDELVNYFEAYGGLFVDTVLPDVKEINQIYCG